jgi:thiol-disulfide isomerase/thioredoxin
MRSVVSKFLSSAIVSVAFCVVIAGANNSALKENALVLPSGNGVGQLAPDLEFSPLQGKRFRLSDITRTNHLAIVFTSTTCPVSKRYVPTLRKLEKEFSTKGITFVYVNPIGTDPRSEIRNLAKEYGWESRYVLDANRKIQSALNASSTTELFLIDRGRTLVYRGAVDDQYGLGFSLEKPRREYAIEALNAMLAGEKPRVQRTTAPGCALEPAMVQNNRRTTVLTYHGRISRILQNHCVECHRAGGNAPFSLESYEQVVEHAGMIRKEVEKGAMPPWFAAPMENDPHRWENDRQLPDEEKAALLAWLQGSKTKGNREDAPLPRQFRKGWEIGAPDVVIRLPEPVQVKATGKMPYQNIFVETGFTEDKWVQAIEMRPTAKSVVHHALVYVIPPGEKIHEKSRRPARAAEGGNFFAVYVPGNHVLRYADGLAKLVPAGSTLHFQMHYTPSGTATNDQTELGLVFAKTAPRHEVRVAAIAGRLDIPPGEANYVSRGKIPVPFDAQLLSFMPHMHVRGKAFRYELELPNGQTNLLLDVPRYDFNWQLQYKLREYISAPAGSTLRGTAIFDNSANNPANPDPNARVKWGEQTDDEMMLGYFEYIVPSLAPGEKTSIVEAALRDGGLIFNGLDKNKDGRITRNESPTEAQFNAADANADGQVDREEFATFWRKQRAKSSRDSR